MILDKNNHIKIFDDANQADSPACFFMERRYEKTEINSILLPKRESAWVAKSGVCKNSTGSSMWQDKKTEKKQETLRPWLHVIMVLTKGGCCFESSHEISGQQVVNGPMDYQLFSRAS